MDCKCFCPDLSETEFEELDFKEFDLTGKTFYVSKAAMLSHFPVNPELKIEKTIKQIEENGFQLVSPLFVIFEDGMLSGKILVEIVKPSSRDSSVITMQSLKLVAKSYTGPKYLVPKALKQFDNDLVLKNINTSNFYFWYHSCKKCEKEKGSRTVILGKIV